VKTSRSAGAVFTDFIDISPPNEFALQSAIRRKSKLELVRSALDTAPASSCIAVKLHDRFLPS
jgi:hypothetical protein